MPDATAARGHPDPLRVPLGSLDACQCRWPVEAAPQVIGKHLFCGLPTELGQVYCAPHRKRGRAIWRAADDA